ncbi:MAG: hypothetical protein JNM17_33225 [Archangium sp.]|nr:hypothetical protein [Archangium sp.]
MTLVLALLLAQASAEVPATEATPTPEQEIADLKERLLELERKVEDAQGRAKAVQDRMDAHARFKVDPGGYLDLGFFWVQGNGSGVRRDLEHFGSGNRYGDILGSWVLIGDPLSTTINARGDAADLSDSRAVRFDALHSQGRPSFIINTANLSFRASLDNTWFVSILVDLLPRERIFNGGGSVGDFIDVKMASLRWEGRFDWGFLTINAGKFDSLLGIEYRTQEAPQRLTVTPSLLCRYTCGRPLGLKARAEFFGKHLEIAAALTNGSSELETFPFSNETDFNFFKTVSGRVAVRLPVLDGLELIASGAVGAQDRQRDDGVMQWHLGAAARLDWGRLQVMAEYVIGRANGKDAGAVPCGTAPCIKYKGAYGLVGVRLASYFLPYARVDWRQADLRSGFDYAYMSDVLRATIGLRYEPSSRVAVKAEYTFNAEFTRLQIPNDILTTSFVVSY